MRNRFNRFGTRTLIYGALSLWAFICLLPIYWTVTTALKTNKDVLQGNAFPWLDYAPSWIGWRYLGLSPDRILIPSTQRDEFLMRIGNSLTVAVGGAGLALILGSLAAYGLVRFKYRVLSFRNDDISFFFLSQLFLPPVVIALPTLVMYRGLSLLDTQIGLILIYTVSVMPIVIWIMRDQFTSIPHELEQAAMVDGCGVWETFIRIVLPLAGPGMVAAFIISLVLCWNEYFLAALLTSTNAKTLPVMVASQNSAAGVSWANMAALAFASILPLIVVGVFLERYIVKGLTAGAVK